MNNIIDKTKGYCLKRDNKTGQLYYLYDVSQDMSFNFSLLCEVGEPYKLWFIKALKRNKIEKIAVETEKDYFEIDSKFVSYWTDKALHITIGE
jgi:hypothetical protein